MASGALLVEPHWTGGVRGVVAVVVAYQPDLDILRRVLMATVPQVGAVVIVDNGSDIELSAWLRSQKLDDIAVLRLSENRGVGTAQNEGIRHAKRQGGKFVLLMDQDSVPAPDMVANLLAAACSLPNVAAVGPRYVDPRRNRPMTFVRVEGLRLRKQTCQDEHGVAPVDHLIASGCLIPLNIIDIVGEMREDLFIDYVDTEWGLRAQHLNLQSYGVCAASMLHSLGDAPLEVGRRKIALHSPIRHYYRYRNALILYRDVRIPWNWKLIDAWQLMLRYWVYVLLAKPRWERFRMMTLGILHGLVGRTGRY